MLDRGRCRIRCRRARDNAPLQNPGDRWSEGGWTGPNYAVAYAVGDSPFGPFERVGTILQQDPAVATGAGHHSVLRGASGRWYIVYHRRPLGETDRNHRVVCIDELIFEPDGTIRPVVITKAGVPPDPIR